MYIAENTADRLILLWSDSISVLKLCWNVYDILCLESWIISCLMHSGFMTGVNFCHILPLVHCNIITINFPLKLHSLRKAGKNNVH
jgi:hypothetical protein